MPNKVNDIVRFTPGKATSLAGLTVGNPSEPPRRRASGPLSTLQDKVSSRLARHIALERRRLVNAGPMVSFTFDDAATSAGLTGAERLEEMRGRGTYYIASGLIGQAAGYSLIGRDRVRELHLRGHEIGLHGHAHRAAGAFSAQHFRDDLQENRDWLEAIHEGIRPTNFAYPYGLASFARKRQLYGLVASSRSVAPGVNAGDFDPQFLHCVELADARLTPQMLAFYLDVAARTRGWLIFCTHDIADSPTSYGCTPGLFQRALDGAASRGVEIVTIAAALKRSHIVGKGKLSRTGATRSTLS
ncbi:MAG: polysaccharide deacetylase family protein [Roseiarcus sp.]